MLQNQRQPARKCGEIRRRKRRERGFILTAQNQTLYGREIKNDEVRILEGNAFTVSECRR